MGQGAALAMYPRGSCGLRDLEGNRSGEVARVDSNTNLQNSRTLMPSLRGEHAPGRYWLICAVLATVSCEEAQANWNQPPSIRTGSGSFVIVDSRTGETVWPHVPKINAAEPPVASDADLAVI